MTINAKQIVLIVIAMLSFLAGASANLTELFGTGVAKLIVSSAVFVNGMMSAALTPFLSNANVVIDAKAQTGVNVLVDRTAAPNIAALAVDPKQTSIEPAPGEAAAVKQVATGA
jgi:hypothetical protein